MKVLVISLQSLTANSAGGTGRIAFQVAERLSENLQYLIVSSKGKFETNFRSKAVSPISRYYLFILNKILKPIGLKYHVQRFIEEVMFDIFCTRHINKNIDVIFSTNPYLFRTLSKAKRLGIKVIFFAGNPNENLIVDLLTNELEKMRFEYRDSYLYPPRLRFYNRSLKLFDSIICSNELIYSSFKQYKIAQVKLISGLVLPSISKMRVKSVGKIFSVGYLAYSVPLKGLHHLLRAWNNLKLTEATLYIGGPISHNYKTYLFEKYKNLDGVIFTGSVSDPDTFFESIDLFVSPSVIDGQPVTVLEAMQNEITSAVSKDCGISFLIKNRENGFVFSLDSEELEDILEYSFNNRDILAKMGKAAGLTYSGYSHERFLQSLVDDILYFS